MLSNKQLQGLADITGEDFFSAEEFMTNLYSHDIAALPGLVNDILVTKAEAVAQPVNAEIVSNLLKYCIEHKIPVVPRGHGTSGYGGALPTRGGLVIETTRMNKIHEIDKDKMTVEVGAGIIWGKLLEDLEEEGVTVRAYPSSALSSTVGGWVAAGGIGIGSTKYGGIREQVVDMETVLPDGRIVRTNDPQADFFDDEDGGYSFFPGEDEYLWSYEDQKIQSGKEIKELMVDSNGTLGVITRVVLKLIPLKNIHPVVASFSNREAMQTAMEDILKATRPFYLHFITDIFHKMLAELDMAPESAGEWLILAAFEGTQDEITEGTGKLLQIVHQHNGTIESEEIANHEWAERFYPMRIKRLGPSLAPSEVYVPLQRLSGFLQHMDKHFKGESYAAEGAVSDKGEVAVLTWFLDDERKRISFLMGWYRSLDVINLGVKHGGRAYSIGMWNVAYSRSFFGKHIYGKMAKIKKKTDPKNYMNPHKVFTGPLRLSLRLNLLIVFAAAVAAPIILWLAGLIVPSILNAYVPWLIITDLSSILLAFGLGIIAGVAVIEIANLIPISFMLTIGGPFLRIGRKIWH